MAVVMVNWGDSNLFLRVFVPLDQRLEAVFSRGGFSRLTFLKVICLPTVLSSLSDVCVSTTALYSFFMTLDPCYSGNYMKLGGKRRCLQICYSYVYSCAIALVPGLKKEKVSAKAQVACYLKSKKKNESLFLSEDVRRCKRRSQGNLFGF